MRIYLIGFMGSGKTTLGKGAAHALHVPFMDTDAEVVRMAGRTVPEIFREQGEPYFRQLEHQVIRATLSIPKGIIATGGGLPCHDQNMDWMLLNGICIYLEWPFEVLIANLLKDSSNRPLLGDQEDMKQKHAEQLFKRRQTCYEQAAMTIQMTGDQSKDQQALIKCCSYIW